MPKKESKCVDDLRYAEYYDMQNIFDDLYDRSLKGKCFPALMSLVLKRENILLAYRNIKANTGSRTAGTDGLTIKDIGNIDAEEVVEKVRSYVLNKQHGYRPKPVKRVEIPKPDGKMRPLGIPCIWDRLIQQCIKQIMEPICEARFSNNSYGFRPGRSVEHAIQRTYQLLQVVNLNYVVEFDIKGFFDNVNHEKLIRQIWAFGIHDKTLIFILKRILKSPIKMSDGHIESSDKGTPQGGIISPLLANIVLNELDRWIDSQWESNKVITKYAVQENVNGSANKGNAYRAMRKTNLKEMYIVRYADDFRIFCKNENDAKRIFEATKCWLKERLKLDISEEKSKIVNVREKYMNFLGFKIMLRKKHGKYVVNSHMSDISFQRQKEKLISQLKKIANLKDSKNESDELYVYNSMIMGIHNYYCIATNITIDCNKMHRQILIIMKNRLDRGRGSRLSKHGRPLTEAEIKKYGDSSCIRYLKGCKQPIYPISFVQHKKPMMRKRSECYYTASGRKDIHSNLENNKNLMLKLMKQSSFDESIEYKDNKISKFSSQQGKCAVTGKVFVTTDEIHCHHIIPKEFGGDDSYQNLVLVLDLVHRLIHAKKEDTIRQYLDILKLESEELRKVNSYREKAGNEKI